MQKIKGVLSDYEIPEYGIINQKPKKEPILPHILAVCSLALLFTIGVWGGYRIGEEATTKALFAEAVRE